MTYGTERMLAVDVTTFLKTDRVLLSKWNSEVFMLSSNKHTFILNHKILCYNQKGKKTHVSFN